MPILTNDLIALNQEINEVPRPSTFLRTRLFGGRERNVEAYHVAYDSIKGKKVLAPFVNAEIGFKHMPRAGFITRTLTFPLIAPLDVLTEADLMSRIAGEAFGGNLSGDERQARDRARRQSIVDDSITRREEAMIGEMLYNRTLTITGEGISQTINCVSDLGWTAIDDITNGTKDWDAATPNPTILADIRAWKNTIRDACGLVPDTLILGANAADSFINSSAVVTAMSALNYNIGQVRYADVQDAEFLGTVFGVDVFAYTDGYINDAGAEADFIGANYAVMCCSAQRVIEQTMMYGMYHDVVSGTSFSQSRVLVPGEGDSIANVSKWKMVARPLPYIPYAKSTLSVQVTD